MHVYIALALVALVGTRVATRERECPRSGALTCRRDAAQNSHWQRIVSSIRSLLTTFLQCILEALGSAYQHSLLHPFTADYSPHMLICWSVIVGRRETWLMLIFSLMLISTALSPFSISYLRKFCESHSQAGLAMLIFKYWFLRLWCWNFLIFSGNCWIYDMMRAG